MKKKICSKCGNNPTHYVEVWNASIIFAIDSDGYPHKEGCLEPGNPEHVEAHCLCGHIWKIRGVRQITDITRDGEEDGEDNPEEGS